MLQPAFRLRAAIGLAVTLGVSLGYLLPAWAQTASVPPRVPVPAPEVGPSEPSATTSIPTSLAASPASSLVPPVIAPPADNPASLHLGNADGTIALDDAFAVVRELWAQRERALAEDDIALLERLETGVVLDMDVAAARQDLSSHARPSGALGGREFRGMNLTVGTQPGYPAMFLAQLPTRGFGDQASRTFIHIFVLRRADPASPWRLAFDADYGGGTKYVYDYYETPRPTWIDPAVVHQQLAAYWQHWKDAGTAPDGSLFAPGPWTTERGELIASVHQDGLRRECRCRTHVEYSADPADDGIYRFGIPEGEFVCSAVRVDSVERPGSKLRLLVQDPARRNWGALLAPGWYRRIADRSMYQTCILIRPESDPRGRGLDPLGGGDSPELTAMTGVPASAVAAFIAIVWRSSLWRVVAMGVLAFVATLVRWRSSSSRSSTRAGRARSSLHHPATRRAGVNVAWSIRLTRPPS